MSCPFCEQSALESRTVAENAMACAFLTNAPIVPGHVLIAPRRHCTYYQEMTAEEMAAIEALRMVVHAGLTGAFGAEGFNYAWNEKKIGGQSVPHFHLHVLPRKQGDTGTYNYEPREFLYRPIPAHERPESPASELEMVAGLIKQHLP